MDNSLSYRPIQLVKIGLLQNEFHAKITADLRWLGQGLELLESGLGLGDKDSNELRKSPIDCSCTDWVRIRSCST